MYPNLFSTNIFGKPLLTFLAILPCTFYWVLGIRANASTPYLYILTLLPYPSIFLPLFFTPYFTVLFIPDSLYLFALYYTPLSCLYISFIHSLYFTYYILFALFIVYYFYTIFACIFFIFTTYQAILPLINFLKKILPPLIVVYIRPPNFVFIFINRAKKLTLTNFML